RRAAARHRQDRHPRPDPAQELAARSARVGDHEAPSGHGPRDPEGQPFQVRAHGRAHRPRASRALRRLRLPQRAGRRPHSPVRAHRRARRRLRRAHLRAALQARLEKRAGLRLHPLAGGQALRPEGRRGVPGRARRSRAHPEGMVRPALAALKRPLAALKRRLANRPDTEHEQALVRVALGLVLGLYLLPEILDRRDAGEPHILVWFSYTVASIALFIGILRAPGASPLRRTIGAALDAATTTWCMVHFEALAAPMILIYIWSTVGMGFRFGPRQLFIALALSVVGFTVVLALSDFWRAHRAMGIGFMVGLVVLCLYVRKLVRQLFDALSRAEAANQAKRRFISVVSHEMRTPLNAIIGMAELLRETPLSSEQADMLQTLRGSSRVMLNLVEDVLDFSKIEAGKLTLEKTDFDVHALVNSTSRILATQALAKGIELVVSIMPEVPPAVRGDPHYLRQVLINLVGNAVKFTERGSVTVHVSAHSETEQRVRLKFSIRDTGIGIAPEAQKRIFESFAQADQSTTRRFGGTG